MKASMNNTLFTVLASLSCIAFARLAAGAAPAASSAIQPYVGDWVGAGWGWEERFRQSQREFVQQFPGAKSLPGDPGTDQTVMSLTVRHVTHYHFKVDAQGNVAGEGEITYDLFPNLCGEAALTRQVNETVNMMARLPTILKLAGQVGARAVEQFNADFYAQEAKLAERMSLIQRNLQASRAADYPQATGGVTVDQRMTQRLMSVGQPAGVEDLISKVIWQGCFEPTERIAGTIPPCLDFLVQPALKSGQPGWETVFDTSLKLVFDQLKDATKTTFKNLDLQSQQEAAACSETDDALVAGTKVGPSNGQELAVQMAPAVAKAGMDVGTGSMPHGLLLSIPGVTQVQYYYKGLTNGPESRDIKLKGRLVPAEGGAKLYLEMDGDVAGGDKRLFVEYMVNYKKEVRPFPAWSPFLEKPGDAQPSGKETVHQCCPIIS